MKKLVYLITSICILTILLLTGCGGADSTTPDPIPATNSQPVQSTITNLITIASFNVENFDNTGAFANIANLIKTNNVDILFVSEIQDNDGDEASFTSTLTAAGYSMQYHSLSSYE